MKRFRVTATRKEYIETTIVAESIEEALQKATELGSIEWSRDGYDNPEVEGITLVNHDKI